MLVVGAQSQAPLNKKPPQYQSNINLLALNHNSTHTCLFRRGSEHLPYHLSTVLPIINVTNQQASIKLELT